MIGIAGVFGGLVFSVIKRAGGVKDSGVYVVNKRCPLLNKMHRFYVGHGGVSDRFDTMILCAPASFYFATLATNQQWWLW